MAFSYKLFLWSFILLPLAKCDDSTYKIFCAKDITDNINLRARIVSTTYYLIEVAPAKGYTSSIFSSSQDGSILYGLAQCRGDANTDLCKNCIKDAGIKLHTNCASQAQAYILYDLCFLHYDVVNFLGNWTIPGAENFLFNKKEAQNSSIFVPAVKLMVGNLKTTVVAGSETNLFAKAVASNITGLDGVSIYGMAQCMGDLKKSACIECLTYIEDLLPSKCGNRSGCRFFYNSCFVRYESYNFFTSKSR